MIKNVAANIWKDIKQLITLKSTNKGTQTLFQIINDETFTQKFSRSAKRIWQSWLWNTSDKIVALRS